VFLSRCGDHGASDLQGVYAVTHHTRNDYSCSAEGGAVNEFAYFRLLKGTYLGVDYLSYGECTSSALSSCDNLGILTAYYYGSDGWKRTQTWHSGGGAVTCTLGCRVSIIHELGGGKLRIETRTRTGEDDTLSEEDCSTSTASDRCDSMSCDSLEVLEGER
jgi:hypothetical protein